MPGSQAPGAAKLVLVGAQPGVRLSCLSCHFLPCTLPLGVLSLPSVVPPPQPALLPYPGILASLHLAHSGCHLRLLTQLKVASSRKPSGPSPSCPASPSLLSFPSVSWHLSCFLFDSICLPSWIGCPWGCEWGPAHPELLPRGLRGV